MEQTDKELAMLLQQGDEQAFEKVFTTYYKALHTYAFTIVKQESAAEEIVQEVFYRIWKKKDRMHIQTSLKAYLYASVFNESMDYLRKLTKIRTHTLFTVDHDKTTMMGDDAGKKVELNELEYQLQLALNKLPEQCRTVFQLSRFEGLKYFEIAAQLGLSVKTIEAQMGKALKRLRISLAEFLSLLIFLLWH